MILLFEQKCHLFFFVPEDPQWQPPKPTGLQRTGDPSKGQIWGFSSLYNLTIPFSGTQYCNIGWRLNHSLDSSSSPSATSRVISKASNYPWLNMWTCYHWYVTLIQNQLNHILSNFWSYFSTFNFWKISIFEVATKWEWQHWLLLKCVFCSIKSLEKLVSIWSCYRIS